ncbi:MAG TPA: histidine--tRNA ligase, partial [Actinomycetota bacterium]|nr:histidine--tRNA ligase [Actinomycetota bacterium]
MPFSALPGFRDFYPDDMAVRNHIFAVWRDVARRYGFEEVDGPPLESLDLFVAKSGPEIVQQLYAFTDKGDRQVALRAEMTPTLARMAGARAGGLRKPIKWFSVPQLFRYERAQRGRLREHFQLNMDIIGEPGIGADAELLAAALDVVRSFGLGPRDVIARVSSRGLLAALLTGAGVDDERLPLVYNLIDKLEREGAGKVADRLRSDAQLDPKVVDAVLEPFAQPDLEGARAAVRTDEAGAELQAVEDLFARLRAMGMDEFLRFDLSIVRGLAYYTGIVWELFDVAGELRAVAGGGRYDRLLAHLTDVDLPALGFGMGDVVLRELLSDKGLLPSTDRTMDFFVVAVSEDQREAVLSLVSRLRGSGRSVDYSLSGGGVGKQFKAASAAGATRVVVIG